MTWSDWDKTLLALVMWREARGEGREGMRAVGHVVKNRVKFTEWDRVIAAKWQFSSMAAPGDPELILWPEAPDPVFETAMSLAEVIYSGEDPDNTNGATHYFNPNVVLPSWAATMTKVASIGHHDFYK